MSFVRPTLKTSFKKIQAKFSSSNDISVLFKQMLYPQYLFNDGLIILQTVCSVSTVYIVEVRVVDINHPGWTCSSRVRVAVEDVNDNPPTFTVANETITLTEDAAVGMIIARLQVFDLDLGECSTFTILF